MLRLALLCYALLLHLGIATPVQTAAAQVPTVRFNRDVRPILADKCFRCHGPDAAARKSDMRLDSERDAKADRGGYRIIDPGKSSGSELMRRVLATDIENRMPPQDSGTKLTKQEISILKSWIDAGADYEAHWSFTRPTRPSPTKVTDARWPKHELDRFVLARLEREGLRPSPEADPALLIRRVTLDATGLPPTFDEVDAFERESKHQPDSAYERLVDRLLASPRFGEHMASSWLDAARYADTNGYFTDNDRTMWPWRDWVIDAFNNNQPFDQFTIEQLAGDLLPGSTIDQKIATGFNRNHMVNNETGIVEEEFRVEYVVDRVDTTATVWMGLTLGCARCHDHKYDPISQKDFYRFFAFFNNVPERGLSGSGGNAAPLLKVPAADYQTLLDQVDRQIAAAQPKLIEIEKQLQIAQSEWERTAVERLPQPPTRGLVVHYALDQELRPGITTGSVTIVPGMLESAARFRGDGCVSIEDSVDFDRHQAFSFGAWIQPAGAGCVLSKMDDAANMRGIDVTLRKGRAIVNLVHRWNRDAIRIATKSKIPSGRWHQLMVTYDGSSKAAGVKIYLDGELQPVEVILDNLAGSIRNREPLRIGRRQSSASYTGLIDDVRLYDRQLTAKEVGNLATGQLLRGIVTRSPAARSAIQKRQLREWYLEHRADRRLALVVAEMKRLRDRRTDLLRRVPTTMVMQESKQSRPTFVLDRGEYNKRGEQVAAGVLTFLNRDAAKQSADSNRLTLARWLVDPNHPLTARVTVNRLWQQLFGSGIVKSVGDFGTQGDWPSHPELLDWMAVELIQSGWDIKHLLRLILTSATYRQTSNAPPTLHQRDPENRLLARGPRFRMSAETLRDSALAASGLLVEKLGGPSVMPYQPAGLWKDVTYDSDRSYQPDTGESLYRRSLYTFWKRQSPPPAMLVFDAPTRETCVVQRSRTNTPLQALVLMNDPTFIEASRKLAERALNRGFDSAAANINFAFRTATARRPAIAEAKILLDVFREQKVVFENDRTAAVALLSVGESKRDESIDSAELAALTTIVSMILSLDETITKP